MAKINIVPGTVKPAVIGLSVMLLIAVISYALMVPNDAAGRWIPAAAILVTYVVTFACVVRARRRWEESQRLAISKETARKMINEDRESGENSTS